MYLNPKDSPWHLKRGCITGNNPLDFRQHCGRLQKGNAGYLSSCCSSNLCNNHTESYFHEQIVFPKHTGPDNFSTFIEASSLLAVIIFICISIFVARKFRKKSATNGQTSPTITRHEGQTLQTLDNASCVPLLVSRDNGTESNGTTIPTVTSHIYAGNLRASAISDSSVREHFGFSSGSGSGSGMPFLQQLTISRQITKKVLIGKGRYGEIWRASWKCNDVTVKVFPTHEEESFKREVYFYHDLKLGHVNLLGIIGADMTSVDSRTEYWLITYYHELGSLYDYLRSTSPSIEETCQILYSISHGLRYLHKRISATEYKPPIAHRDLKSKNIIMKSSRQPCIANLDLAIMEARSDLTSNNIDNINKLKISNIHVGTTRYMSPEVLNETLKDDSTDFTSFLLSDIYSFALIMWETLNRTTIDNCTPYQHSLPYEDKVPNDPSFGEMKKCVVDEEYRPIFASHLNDDNKLISKIKSIIIECWNTEPKARQCSSRVQTSLNNLMSEFKITKS